MRNAAQRAGAITEVVDATGGDLNAGRAAAGHGKIDTTLVYARADERPHR